MSITVSTKFKELILGPNSFGDIFDGGRILLYDGVQPANADMAALTPAIAEITTNGLAWAPGGNSSGGLQYELAGQWVTKATAQVWKLNALSSGTPTWFRIFSSADDNNALSYSYARIDGAVSDTPATELVLPNVSLVQGNRLDIQQFLFTILPLTGA